MSVQLLWELHAFFSEAVYTPLLLDKGVRGGGGGGGGGHMQEKDI